jgi:hypothetical protein
LGIRLQASGFGSWFREPDLEYEEIPEICCFLCGRLLASKSSLTTWTETGGLSINSNTSVRFGTPFGGMKQSGVGRELGPHALDYYTEVKNVFVSTEED